MSQVLAAEAVSAVSAPARETLAAARKSACFAAVFDQARKASRQEQERSDRLDARDRSRSRERISRTGEPEGSARAKAADTRARPTDNTRTSRADRLQEAGDDDRADAASADESAEQADQARQDAKPRSAEPEQDTSQVREPAVPTPHEESNDHASQPQPIDFTNGIQTFTPPSVTTAPATGNHSGSPGSAGLPAGTSADLPGGAVPVPAQGATGNFESTSVAAGVVRMPTAGATSPDAAADATAAAAGGKAKTATVETQAKPTAGNDFQTLLGQAGRSRQLAPSLKAAATSSVTPAEATRQPIDMDSAAGPGDLARVLRSKVGARHSNMSIRLDPPELGQVRVDVRMRDEAMIVRFEAQTQAGHDALQGRLRELTGALEQQGVRVDSIQVDYRPPAEGQQDGQSPSQQQSGGQQGSEPRFAGDGGQWQDQPQTFTSGDASGTEASLAGVNALTQAGSLTTSGVDVVI